MQKNDVSNEYILVWRVCNNIDSNRDLYIDGHTMCLDATTKIVLITLIEDG